MTVRPLTGRPTGGELEAELARLDVLARELLETVPGTALMAFDTDLRMRLMRGPGWRDAGLDGGGQLGRHVTEVFSDEVLERVMPEYRAVLAGLERAFTLSTSRRARWVSARPIRDGAGAVIGGLAVSFDGSQTRDAEDQYRLLAENATDVVSRLDRQGRFVYISPSIEALTGWAPGELLGRTAGDLTHPDD